MSRPEPPAVVLLAASDADERALAALRAGLEEEGVPGDVRRAAGTPDARAAAAASKLRLGVALDARRARLDVRRAEGDASAAPVLDAGAGDLAAVRALGQDAGRMAKGVALRRAEVAPFFPPTPR